MKRSWVAAVVAVLLASLVSALTACAARHEGSKGDGPKAHETTSPSGVQAMAHSAPSPSEKLSDSDCAAM